MKVGGLDLFFRITPSKPWSESLAVFFLCAVASWANQNNVVEFKILFWAVIALGLALLWGLYFERYASASEQHIRRLCARYDVSPVVGFLPTKMPTRLPLNGPYGAWEKLSKRLPELLKQQQQQSDFRLKGKRLKTPLQVAVEALPCLSDQEIVKLASEPPEVARRAYVVLGQIVHAYVHASELTGQEKGSCAGGAGSDAKDLIGGGGGSGGAGGLQEVEGRTLTEADNATETAPTTAAAAPTTAAAAAKTTVTTAAMTTVATAARMTAAAAAVVPGQVAVPFHFVCTQVLSLPCVLTAAGTDLWNWTTADEDEEGDDEDGSGSTLHSAAAAPSSAFSAAATYDAASLNLANPKLRLVSSLTGTDSEKWFHLVPLAMHARCGPLIGRLLEVPHLLAGLSSASSSSSLALTLTLSDLASCLVDFKALFERTPSLVDRDAFYHGYRPLLNGFFPAGMVLRLDIQNRANVHDVTVRPKGPSAGQSTLFVLIDLVLGVRHAQTHHTAAAETKSEVSASLPGKSEAAATTTTTTKKEEEEEGAKGFDGGGGDGATPTTKTTKATMMPAFQTEMLDYMPKLHSQLVLDFAQALKASGHARGVHTALQSQRHGPRDHTPSNANANSHIDNTRKRKNSSNCSSGVGRGDGGGSSGSRSRRQQPAASRQVEAVAVAYAEAVAALAALRRSHLKVVSAFLASNTNTGTGASPFHRLLSEALRNTNDAAADAAAAAAAAL